MLKRKILILLAAFLIFASYSDIYSQHKSKGSHKYKSHTYSTKYEYGKTYKTTGYTKVKRSESAKKQFLKSRDYKKVPYGYDVDHIIPLSKGGRDDPSNMQLLTKQAHKYKTANERHSMKKNSYSKKYHKKKKKYN